MDYNKPLDLLHMAEETVWVKKVNTARVDGRICSWASAFHPEKLPCRLDGGFLNGSYNVGQRILFDDGTTWLLRLPRASSVSPEYADEKVAMEVEALFLIREKTSIPVPKIYAWGPAEQNELGLGPFILMEFISGVCLNDVFGGGDSRLLKEEISETDIAYVYRQMARFMLQLFKIDFSCIGSLPTPKTRLAVPSRPLTWKGHEILRVGGVNVFGEWAHGFTSTRQYFEYVNNQDWRQLLLQRNSIAGPRSARSRYAGLNILKSLIPELINTNYDRGPFKIICDDFGLANVMVRSKDDLTIIGVVDIEWVYAGPAQLFGSAPWWLLLDRPVNDEWDFEEGEAPKATDRYFKCLEIFIHVLEEEEIRMTENGSRELSELVRWSRDTGAMWLHMLLSSGFFDTLSFPYMQLRKHKGAQWWDERMDYHEHTEEVEKFVAAKLKDLAAYDEIKGKVDHLKVLMDNEEMAIEDFISSVSSILKSD
ncbi:hypothetical protein KXW39_000824 [Aspergillus fumigatus]|nr:hypothetical protein KXX29_009729 [Aspergillus fumigatus]KAH1519471.1 hypothetical protein KXX06_009907 [Aspergillus fumigatus]KAH1570000.1 hypothetical protein KXX17_001188 [Aspergillus fumigatus]KAH2377262.1 hypothetical protein KXV62_000563 [Aspergillus fumigatus]KAH3305517.1 hypothetical protein KXV87_000264 [Aspergillus fumigatus]